SRPGISLLNPYVDKQDPMNIKFGNSDLDVEKGHNIQLTYSLFGSRFMMNAALQHSFVNNGIESYTFFDDNVLYTTYGNIGKKSNTSLNLFVNWTVTPSTRLTLNSTTSYVDLRSEGMNFRNHGWQQNLMANVQQTLPGNFKLSLMYFGGTPTYSLQGKSSGINIHSIGLTKSLLKDRLNLSLNVVNPFKDSMKMTTNTRGEGFKTTSTTQVKMRSVVFTVSFNIGNLKPKNKASNNDSHGESDVKNAENQTMQMNSIFM
ncbi:MAG: outer membrane beta-barrel protein, partial [Bacteroidaceae bacterium]|nr:outer membrane beta-barrel protein [Bacteroidaceae bacterium]